MAKYIKVQQNTSDWHMLRMARPTASSFDKILTPNTVKLSAQAEHYRWHLLAEYMVGHPILEEATKWMERGQELESEAIAAAEFALELDTEPGGFVTTDDERVGCSPDRLIGKDSLLEIKCPKDSNHVGYMLTRAVEYKYKVQLQGQLWVCERETVKIVSYHPEMRTVILTVNRDEEFIAKLSSAMNNFCDILQAKRLQLEQQYGPFKKPKPPAPEEDKDYLGVTDKDAEMLCAAFEARKAAQ